MYTYSFKIYVVGCPDVFMSIILMAKDKFSPYENILIKVLNEGKETWSTSIDDSINKEGIYSGAIFFDMLSKESFWGYTSGDFSLETISPFMLYAVLKRAKFCDAEIDTDDPTDISDPGTYFDDMYDPNVVY